MLFELLFVLVLVGNLQKPTKNNDSAGHGWGAMVASAHASDRQFQVLLASAYWNGEGVAEDKAGAARWYRKAAEQGHARAQRWIPR